MGNLTRLFFLVFLLLFTSALSGEATVTLASTTSTENSGLYDFLLPKFTQAAGIEVRVIAVGTGQAIKIAERGDADVLLVHHRSSEERFVVEGYGVDRRDVMYNDFVIVGPENDPADIAGLKDVAKALENIARAQSMFISRGDDSGTHKKELYLWKGIGRDVQAASGTWYRETGSGMGTTLNIAAAAGAYTLTDRGTWLSFQNRRRLKLVVEGDPLLINTYGVIRVNPARFPHVNAQGARIFVEWLTSEAGQRAIESFQVNGENLFFSNSQATAP